MFNILFFSFRGGHFVGMADKRFLTTCEGLKDLEPAMQRLEDAGVWKQIIHRILKFYENEIGSFFAFQIC